MFYKGSKFEPAEADRSREGADDLQPDTPKSSRREASSRRPRRSSTRFSPPEVERVEYLRPEGLPQLEVLAASRSERLWREFHETYKIVLVPELPENRGSY